LPLQKCIKKSKRKEEKAVVWEEDEENRTDEKTQIHNHALITAVDHASPSPSLLSSRSLLG
jgi:hypothetical protein